jgi:hypothetical protein
LKVPPSGLCEPDGRTDWSNSNPFFTTPLNPVNHLLRTANSVNSISELSQCSRGVPEKGRTMSKKNGDVHVSKTSGSSWKVTQNGERVSMHRTQGNAIDHGKTEAKRDRVDLVVHGRDGKIRSKDSYGNDPLPPRDTEH